jgi:NADH:ubiquinone oxidoreductase subunit E
MPPKQIRVCCGNKCSARNSESIMNRLEQHFGLAFGLKNEQVDLDFTQCVDYCEQGPNVVINDEYIIHEANTKTIAEKIEKNEVEKLVHPTLDTIAKDDFLGDIF